MGRRATVLVLGEEQVASHVVVRLVPFIGDVPYRIEYDPEAVLDLHHHRRQQSTLRRQIDEALTHEPLTDSTNNGPMRPNALDAQRRLRRHPFRVYYDVYPDEALVYVLAVCEKRGSRVVRRGREIRLDDDAG
jgi:mRNA-degrading endonuclease RelE of RelBE toxin-antitoxin system